MADVQVLKAQDWGNDVLAVMGTVDGVAVEARGWMSAMTNHYQPTDYDEGGNLKDGAKPAVMTDAERLAYMQGLLIAVAPKPIAIPAVAVAVPEGA